MENEENKYVVFTQKYGHYIIAALAILAFGFLFLPLLKVIPESGDAFNLALYSYVNSPIRLKWTMYLAVAFLLTGIVFVLLKDVQKAFLPIGTYCLILAVVLIALTRKFYKLGLVEDASVKMMYGLYLSIAFVSLAALFALTLSYSKEKMTVRDIAEEGMLLALAFVLNLITFYKAPTGGSVNLQMLPLFILAIRHGPTHGLVACGIIYGFLTMVTDGYGFACYPFDYLIAFGGIAVLGAFKPLIFNKLREQGKTAQSYVLGLSMILVGGILATGFRFAGSLMSSVFIWEYSLLEGIVYNLSYVPLSGGLATALTMALYPALVVLNDRFPVKHSLLY